ncbi:hypothetical protein [Roseospira goensis]|uniref:Uncharacterized protein n=1 Tax=Roseospira goensis TaxID=391922 RepID=A0A7W6WJG5_9PROT|nr:hypothetical protein [Roseospira goensis]MBB4284985.1 hypothetical protein [Roseospira goensis]
MRRDATPRLPASPPWSRAPASDPSGGGERRSNPDVRAALQAVYERLLRSLRKAGRDDVLAPLSGLERVDDVLRACPEQVPTLLDLAWQLRDTPDFRPFFLDRAGDAPVAHRGQPIAPCDLTFDQVARALLWGAARLAFDRLERQWTDRRLHQERARRQRRRQEETRGALHARLMAPLKTMLDGGEADPDPEAIRARYPGRDLYPVLKPHLQESWQFAHLDLYARIGTPQARALGHLLGRFRSRPALERVVALSVDDIGLMRTVCRGFAEVWLNLKLEPGPRWQFSAKDLDARTEAEERIAMVESMTFDTLMVEHPRAVAMIRALGLDARGVVRQLTPIFGDEIWDLMAQPEALENARRMPDHLLPVLGRISRRVPPDISAILGHIRDRALAQDLLTFARQSFSDEELAFHLSDPARKPIWNALPAKFNNAYTYQRDALAGHGPRNSEDLRMVCAAIFQSLRLGHPETF